jgi:hypothetical protein
MFDVFDTDVLFYNVFGYILVDDEGLHIRATAVKLNKDPEQMEKNNRIDMPNDLVQYQSPFIIPFGAWVVNNEIKFAVGAMDGYEREVYKINQEFIDKQIRTISGMFHRILDK